MAQCPANMAGEERFPNSCRVYIFLTGSATCGRALSWTKISLSTFGLPLPLFFQFLIQFHQLLFIASRCDRLTRLQQFVVYHTFLIPPNAYHHLVSMIYCASALMDLIHLAVPMSFVVWRWLSAALFSKLKQQSKAFRIGCSVGSKPDISDVIKNVIYKSGFTLKYWIL